MEQPAAAPVHIRKVGEKGIDNKAMREKVGVAGGKRRDMKGPMQAPICGPAAFSRRGAFGGWWETGDVLSNRLTDWLVG